MKVRAMKEGFKGNICDQGKACDLASRGVPARIAVIFLLPFKAKLVKMKSHSKFF